MGQGTEGSRGKVAFEREEVSKNWSLGMEGEGKGENILTKVTGSPG